MKPREMRFMQLQIMLEIGKQPLGSINRITLQFQFLDDFELASDLPMSLADVSLFLFPLRRGNTLTQGLQLGRWPSPRSVHLPAFYHGRVAAT